MSHLPGASGSTFTLLLSSPNCRNQSYAQTSTLRLIPLHMRTILQKCSTQKSSALWIRVLPLQSSLLRERAHQPWFDSECCEARRKARRLATRCRTNAACTEDKQTWRKALLAARKLSHQKASYYWKSKITTPGTNQRHVWQSVNQLLGEGKHDEGWGFLCCHIS